MLPEAEGATSDPGDFIGDVSGNEGSGRNISENEDGTAADVDMDGMEVDKQDLAMELVEGNCSNKMEDEIESAIRLTKLGPSADNLAGTHCCGNKDLAEKESQQDMNPGFLAAEISAEMIEDISALQLDNLCVMPNEKGQVQDTDKTNSFNTGKSKVDGTKEREQNKWKNKLERDASVEVVAVKKEAEKNTAELSNAEFSSENASENICIDELYLKEVNTVKEGCGNEKVVGPEGKRKSSGPPNMEASTKKIRRENMEDAYDLSGKNSEEVQLKEVKLGGKDGIRKKKEDDGYEEKLIVPMIDKSTEAQSNDESLAEKAESRSAEDISIILVDGANKKKAKPAVPAWRLERAEIRAGRILDTKPLTLEVSDTGKLKGKSISSGSRCVDNLLDRKKQGVEIQSYQNCKLADTDDKVINGATTGNISSQEASISQSKSDLLKILPKKKEKKKEPEDIHKVGASPGSAGISAAPGQSEVHSPRNSSEGAKSLVDRRKTSGVTTKENSCKEKMKRESSRELLNIASKSHKILKLKSKHNKDGIAPVKKSKGNKSHELERCLTADEQKKLENIEEFTSSPSLPCMGKGAEGRKTVKQQLREQIKSILLNAGWRIELRPRRGKSYEDSVYVSPQGTGYWSITKAYAVFQGQLGEHQENKSIEDSLKQDHLECVGSSSSFSTIGKDKLKLLKRNIINKRRTKERFISNDKKQELNKGSMDMETLADKQKGFSLQARAYNRTSKGDINYYSFCEWKRTIFSWMIDLGIVAEDSKVLYMNKRRTKAKLDGLLKREGIHCSCCSKILSVSKFELHAGSKDHQPYENIFVEDSGLSLLQCLLDAWKKQEPQMKWFYNVDDSDDPSDDTCGICGDGGDLICCDSCPSTFHLSCLEIEMLPPGNWHCRNCLCMFCELASPPKESGASSTSLLSCSLCARKFHHTCRSQDGNLEVGFSNTKADYCCQECCKAHRKLQKLIGVRNDLEAGFSWSIVRRFDDSLAKSSSKLLKKIESNSKVAVAFAVLGECFCPILDERSGINILHNVVFNCGSNYERLNYGGFYTFILERGDEIISAASVRIHGGSRFAEMPFIGTRSMYRRQGMCRRLLDGIESALRTINVERLIVPVMSEMTNIWNDVFGFKPLDASQKQDTRSANMLVFPASGLLQKPLLLQRSGDAANRLSNKGDDNIRARKLEGAVNHKSSSSGLRAGIHNTKRNDNHHMCKEVSSTRSLNASMEEPGVVVPKAEHSVQSGEKSHNGSSHDVSDSARNAISSKSETMEAACLDSEEATNHCHPHEPSLASDISIREKSRSESCFPLIPIDSIMSVVCQSQRSDQDMKPVMNDAQQQDCENKIGPESGV